MVVLDTNILIDHLRQGNESQLLASLFERYGVANLSVCIVTVQELFAGASSKFQKEKILTLLDSLKVWPYTHKVAKLAGEVERDFKRDVEFADAAIAATCLSNNCQLATLNGKDFAGITGLQMVDLK